MTEIATSRADCQRERLTRVPPSPSDRLRRIAGRIERLAVAGRTDPETVTVEKLSLAAEVRAVARGIGQ